MPKDGKPDLGSDHEMNRAIGKALGQWNMLEDCLGHVFCAAFGGVNHPVARRAYMSANNFTPRFSMVQAVMQSIQLDETISAKWEALRKRLKDKSDIRNKLTHCARVDEPDKKKGGRIIYVVPNFWKPEYYDTPSGKGKGTRWNWVEVAEFGQEFGQLASELYLLACEIEYYTEDKPLRYHRTGGGLRLHGVLPPTEGDSKVSSARRPASGRSLF